MRLRSSRPGRRNSRKARCLVLAAALVLGAGEGRASAQTSEVDEHVAAALYDRGMVLYELGDVANAKTMFIESLERSSKGSRAGDALRMLRAANEKLGISDLDAGRPVVGDGPLDPYGKPDAGNEGPVDPYGEAGGGDIGPSTGVEQPLDPYGNPTGGGFGGEPRDEGEVSPWSKRGLYSYGAASGFIAGMAILGPYKDTDDDGSADTLRGGAVVAGLLGAGSLGYLSYYLADKLPLTNGESAAIASSGVWGIYNFAHWGNVFTGGSTDANDVYKSMLIGELVGTGVGYWYAKEYDPTEGDVAFVNSFSLYGTSAGLFLGLAMDPPEADAYSLNATLGSLTGIGTGLYFADQANASRGRMLKVDLGAAAGALVPWVLVYPLAADPDTDSDVQWTGFLSAVSMGAGAYLAWYLTDDDDAVADAGAVPLEEAAPSPALIQHGEKSGWSLAAPIIRPMDLPGLAPKDGVTLGADLFSGRF